MVNAAIQKYRKNSTMLMVNSIERDDLNLNHYSLNDTMSQIGAKELIELKFIPDDIGLQGITDGQG